jgi:hypothetical protein
MRNRKLLLKVTEYITGFRVLSTNPPVEEVTGESKGKIGSVNTRTVWTYRNVIGKSVQDRVNGMGIIFGENGEAVTYTLNGTGELMKNFKYIVRGRIKFRAHSRGKLAFLHGRRAKFESRIRNERRILTKVWMD